MFGRLTIATRFWSKVNFTKGCWLWQGAKNVYGYGRIRVGGKSWVAHRYAYLLTHGKIPLGLYVCHHCDTPACVNPAHLFLGTQADNLQDCSQKGRRRHSLTREEVRKIRKELVAGYRNGGVLARKFGVSRQMISRIKLGKAWVGV